MAGPPPRPGVEEATELYTNAYVLKFFPACKYTGKDGKPKRWHGGMARGQCVAVLAEVQVRKSANAHSWAWQAPPPSPCSRSQDGEGRLYEGPEFYIE